MIPPEPQNFGFKFPASGSVPILFSSLGVTQMVSASLDNVVEMTGNVHLGHATRKWKVKVKLVSELQLALLHLLLLYLSVYASFAVCQNEKPPGNQENQFVKGMKTYKFQVEQR